MSEIAKVIGGLQILLKYTPGGGLFAEHDIIGLDTNDEFEVSKEDKKKLDALGWFISSEFDCWSKFV